MKLKSLTFRDKFDSLLETRPGGAIWAEIYDCLWEIPVMLMKNKKPVRSKGRILKLQYGYNANSGTIASFVVAMPVPLMVLMTALGSLTALVSSILLSRCLK